MESKQLRRLLGLVFAFALIAAACGSDGDDDGTGTDADDETSTTVTDTDEGTDETTDEGGDDDGALVDGESLAGLTVVDDLTFTVELETADPEFPLQLSYNAFYPMPSVAFEDPAAFEEAPVGNGPFMIDGVWDHDISIRTVPFADYAGDNPADVTSLTFNIYEDAVSTGYLDLQAGVNDFVKSLPAEQISNAQAEFGDRYEESPNTTFYYYGFPTYLEDQYPLELRQALSMALDRELLNDAILEGTRIPANSVVPPALAGSRDTVCDNWNFDPEGAQAAFESFGGLDALGDDPVIVWFNTSESHEQIAEAVTGQWRDVLGIENFEFQNLEFSEYLPLIDAQELTGVFRLGWAMDYPSPLNFLEPLYASYNAAPVGSNNTIYNNADFDQAIADGREAAAAEGLDAAIPFYQAAEDQVCDDVAVMPIYFGKNLFASNDTVENVQITAFGQPYFEDVVGGDVATPIGEPEHLFPTTTNESEGSEVLAALFKGLVDFDPVTTEQINAVAESITSDDNGQTWTIVLNDGWTFHDGEPVTANSFVDAWSYGAIGANGQQNNSFYSNIVGYADLNPETEEEE